MTNPVPHENMYQVTFSDQSMGELNKLDKHAQMAVIEPISRLTPEDLANPREPLGVSPGAARRFIGCVQATSDSTSS